MARLQRIAPRTRYPRDSRGHGCSTVRTVAHASVGRERLAWIAGEHGNHAAQRVGAVQARCGPAQDLDALDLVERNRFQR